MSLILLVCLWSLPLASAVRLSDRICKYRINRNFNLGRLLSLIPDQSQQIEFLQTLGILPKEQKCEKCTKASGETILATKLVIPENNHYVHFRCKCTAKISIRRGLFMFASKLSFRRFILLAYSFTRWTWSYDQTIQVCTGKCGRSYLHSFNLFLTDSTTFEIYAGVLPDVRR